MTEPRPGPDLLVVGLCLLLVLTARLSYLTVLHQLFPSSLPR